MCIGRKPARGATQPCFASARQFLRVSDPQELATILADQLIDFLSFDHLDVVIFKEKSTEIEWHAWGKGPLPFPDLPAEELPEWNVYNSQEPLHIRDWSRDERFPRLKKLGAALGVDAGTVSAQWYAFP